MNLDRGIEWVKHCKTSARLADDILIGDAAGTELSWGGGTYRHGGATNALEHIMYRHHASSGFTGVSRFADGMSARDIKRLVDEAASRGTVGADGGMVVNMGRVIGTNVDGYSSTTIQVWTSNGVIRTAFPK